MSNKKEIEETLKKCECGGKRKITITVIKRKKWIATCNKCNTGYVIVKEDN